MSAVDFILADPSSRIDFQPIFQCAAAGGPAVAFEALARGPLGSHFEQPAVLFDYIRFKHEEIAADRWCVSSALHAAEGKVPAHTLLSMNVHGGTLERDEAFIDFLLRGAELRGIAPHQLVIEIVEQAPYWNVPKLGRALAQLRGAGVSLALDDLGSGVCNLRTILDTRPDFLKIDAYIVQRCSEDERRRRMLGAICRLARDFGARTVAEGVESEEDLAALREIGFDLVQGFLLGRPAPLSQHINSTSTPTSKEVCA